MYVYVVAPEIVMPNRRIWQSFGRETILECIITALPQAISYWQKDGRRITNTPHPSPAATATTGNTGNDGDGVLNVMPRPSGVPKYRIEAYEDGDHTITLNLRLQVRATPSKPLSTMEECLCTNVSSIFVFIMPLPCRKS